MTNTKHIVMSRVRAIHHMRPFVSTSALCVVLALVSVYAVSREVWVEMVFRNMPNLADIGAVMNFFTYAFLHTGFVVQVGCLVAFFSAIWFLFETTRSFFLFGYVKA